MPLYEYECHCCRHVFEVLTRGDEIPVCPACHAGSPERVVSTFAVTTPGTSQARLAAARVAFKAGKKDQLVAEKEVRDRHQH